MIQRMKTPGGVLRRITCVSLALSLWVTSAPGLEAMMQPWVSQPSVSGFGPRVTIPRHHPGFFTQQAIVQSLFSQRRPNPKKSPGALYREQGLGSGLGASPRIAFRSLVNYPVPSWLAAVGLKWRDVFILSGILMMSFVLPPDVFGNSNVLMGCGVLTSAGRRGREFIMNTMRRGTMKLVRRGVQSAGIQTLMAFMMVVPPEVQVPGFELQTEPVLIHKWVTYKDWFQKRTEQTKVFFRSWQKVHDQALENAVDEGHGHIYNLHTRYATTGSDEETVEQLTKAAHPHSFTEPYWGMQWGRVKGKLQHAYKSIQHTFSFNGDLDAMKRMLKMHFQWNGAVLENDALREKLSKWLYIPLEFVPSGDSPTMAGLTHLFYTQGRFFDSLRYALAVHVFSPDREPPTKEFLQSYGHLMDHLFKHYTAEHPLTADLEDMPDAYIVGFVNFAKGMLSSGDSFDRTIISAMPDEKDRIYYREALSHIRTDLSAEELEQMLLYGTFAFFKNTLDYAVVHEIKSRFEGSIGGSFTSSLNPPGSKVWQVYFALGQGMALHFDEEAQAWTASSDRKVLQNDINDKGSLVTLNDGIGEVAVMGYENGRVKMTLYSGPDNRIVTDEEIRTQRRRDMANPKDVDKMPDPEPTLTDNIMELEAQRTPRVMQAAFKDMKDAREGRKSSDNLKPAKEFTRFLLQKDIEDKIKDRASLNVRNLPEAIDEMLWRRAEKLARRMLSEEPGDKLSEAELVEQIDEAARELDHAIIDARLPQDDLTLLGFFAQARKIVSPKNQLPLRERAKQLVALCTDLLTHPDPTEEDEAPYDIVFIGTEKSEYANEHFAQSLEKMLGLRVLVVSSNDFLARADHFRDDIQGFYRAMHIDPKRTAIWGTSQHAETFDTDLAAKFSARIVREMFVMTGGRHNRLADLVGDMRTFDFQDAWGQAETQLASYAANITAFTGLSLFVGEKLASLLPETGYAGKRLDRRVFDVLEQKAEQLINQVVPEIMGYTASRSEVHGKDYENLDEKGKGLASYVLEGPRTWILRNVVVAALLLFAHSGPVSLALKWVLPVFGQEMTGVWFWVGLLPDVLFFTSLVLSSTIVLRAVLVAWRSQGPIQFLRSLRKPDWKTPPLLFGIGTKKIVIADSNPAVYRFFELYGRKGQALAYGINGSIVEGVSVNAASDERAVALDRRSILLIGRPDNRVPALVPPEAAAKMLGKHAKSVLTMPLRILSRMGFLPVSALIYTFGGSDFANTPGERRARHEHIPAGVKLTVNSEESLPLWAQEFYGDNIDAVKRLLIAGRILTSMVHKIASEPPSYRPGHTHMNTGSKTTAGPWTGDRLIPLVARMPLMVEQITDPDAVHEERAPNTFGIGMHAVPEWRVPQAGAEQEPARAKQHEASSDGIAVAVAPRESIPPVDIIVTVNKQDLPVTNDQALSVAMMVRQTVQVVARFRFPLFIFVITGLSFFMPSGGGQHSPPPVQKKENSRPVRSAAPVNLPPQADSAKPKPSAVPEVLHPVDSSKPVEVSVPVVVKEADPEPPPAVGDVSNPLRAIALLRPSLASRPASVQNKVEQLNTALLGLRNNPDPGKAAQLHSQIDQALKVLKTAGDSVIDDLVNKVEALPKRAAPKRRLRGAAAQALPVILATLWAKSAFTATVTTALPKAVMMTVIKKTVVSYTIEKDMNLTWIARKFNTTVTHLLELNSHLKLHPDDIAEGGLLNVPGTDVASVATPGVEAITQPMQDVFSLGSSPEMIFAAVAVVALVVLLWKLASVRRTAVWRPALAALLLVISFMQSVSAAPVVRSLAEFWSSSTAYQQQLDKYSDDRLEHNKRIYAPAPPPILGLSEEQKAAYQQKDEKAKRSTAAVLLDMDAAAFESGLRRDVYAAAETLAKTKGAEETTFLSALKAGADRAEAKRLAFAKQAAALAGLDEDTVIALPPENLMLLRLEAWVGAPLPGDLWAELEGISVKRAALRQAAASTVGEAVRTATELEKLQDAASLIDALDQKDAEFLGIAKDLIGESKPVSVFSQNKEAPADVEQAAQYKKPNIVLRVLRKPLNWHLTRRSQALASVAQAEIEFRAERARKAEQALTLAQQQLATANRMPISAAKLSTKPLSAERQAAAGFQPLVTGENSDREAREILAKFLFEGTMAKFPRSQWAFLVDLANASHEFVPLGPSATPEQKAMAFTKRVEWAVYFMLHFTNYEQLLQAQAPIPLEKVVENLQSLYTASKTRVNPMLQRAAQYQPLGLEMVQRGWVKTPEAWTRLLLETAPKYQDLSEPIEPFVELSGISNLDHEMKELMRYTGVKSIAEQLLDVATFRFELKTQKPALIKPMSPDDHLAAIKLTVALVSIMRDADKKSPAAVKQAYERALERLEHYRKKSASGRAEDKAFFNGHPYTHAVVMLASSVHTFFGQQTKTPSVWMATVLQQAEPETRNLLNEPVRPKMAPPKQEIVTPTAAVVPAAPIVSAPPTAEAPLSIPGKRGLNTVARPTPAPTPLAEPGLPVSGEVNPVFEEVAKSIHVLAKAVNPQMIVDLISKTIAEKVQRRYLKGNAEFEADVAYKAKNLIWHSSGQAKLAAVPGQAHQMQVILDAIAEAIRFTSQRTKYSKPPATKAGRLHAAA